MTSSAVNHQPLPMIAAVSCICNPRGIANRMARAASFAPMSTTIGRFASGAARMRHWANCLFEGKFEKLPLFHHTQCRPFGFPLPKKHMLDGKPRHLSWLGSGDNCT